MIRRLAGDTAAYTFAQLASRGTALAWLVVLPSFLTPSDYGALGLLLTAAALVNVLVPLEISQALARYYPPAEPSQKRGYVTTAWTFTLLMLTLASTAALVLASPACELLLGSLRYLDAFRVAVVFFFLNTALFFLQSQLRWEFRARDFTIVTLLFAIVTLAGSVGFAATFEDPLMGVLLGQLVGAGAGVAAGLVALRRSLALALTSPKLRQMLRFSLPLVPASVAIILSTYASRFVLKDLLDLSQVGLFTWASQLATVPALLLLGVQAALTPLVMKHHAEPETREVIARAFEGVVAFELCLCLALGLFTPELISFLGYSSYAGAGPLVMLLAPAYLMLQLYVFAPGFAIRERTELQLLVSLLAAATAVVANYLLIGILGVLGAAFATLLGGAAFMGAWFLLSHSLYPTPIRWSQLAVLTAVAAICGAAGILAIPNGAAAPAKIGLLGFMAGVACVLGLLQLRSLRGLLAWAKHWRGRAG